MAIAVVPEVPLEQTSLRVQITDLRSTWAVVRRILPYLRPYSWRMIVLSILLLFQTLASLWIPFLLTIYAVDEVLIQQEWSKMIQLGLLYGILFIVSAVAFLVNRYLIFTVGAGVVRDLRRDLYRHIHSLDLGYLQIHPSGDLISRVLNDVGGVQGLLTSTFLTILSQLILAASAAYLVLSRSWRLTLLSVIIVPFIVLVTKYFNKRARVLSRLLQEQLSVITRSLQESMTGMRLIKTLSRESLRVSKFTHQLEDLYRYSVRRGMVEAFHSQSTSLLVALGGVLVLVVGVHEIRAGTMTPGTLLGFFFVIGRAFYGPVTTFASMNVQIQSSLACLERILELMDAEPQVKDKPDAKRLGEISGTLVFDRVRFSYDAGQPVLTDFNLKVHPGESVALFGPSGAGKSTTINLICRFYDPQQGSVTIDGLDLRDIALDDLRSKIAYVDQDTFLFNASVTENLEFAKPDASYSEIVEACQAAFIHEVIEALPQGYDTVLGERGARLSGGEKQRLSIARAILRDAPIIIFDEATSSLDSRSEALVQEALGHLLKGRTSITIAHRLGTIRAVQRIVVMDEGKIVASGSYEKLLEGCEPFKRFHAQQFGTADAISQSNSPTSP